MGGFFVLVIFFLACTAWATSKEARESKKKLQARLALQKAIKTAKERQRQAHEQQGALDRYFKDLLNGTAGKESFREDLLRATLEVSTKTARDFKAYATQAGVNHSADDWRELCHITAETLFFRFTGQKSDRTKNQNVTRERWPVYLKDLAERKEDTAILLSVGFNEDDAWAGKAHTFLVVRYRDAKNQFRGKLLTSYATSKPVLSMEETFEAIQINGELKRLDLPPFPLYTGFKFSLRDYIGEPTMPASMKAMYARMLANENHYENSATHTGDHVPGKQARASMKSYLEFGGPQAGLLWENMALYLKTLFAPKGASVAAFEYMFGVIPKNKAKTLMIKTMVVRNAPIALRSTAVGSK